MTLRRPMYAMFVTYRHVAQALVLLVTQWLFVAVVAVDADKKRQLTGSDARKILIPMPPGRDPRETVLNLVRKLEQVAVVGVKKKGRNWTLEDFCVRSQVPEIRFSFLKIVAKPWIDRLLPCITISPLNCFCEGAIMQQNKEPIFIDPIEVDRFFGHARLPKGNVTWADIDVSHFTSGVTSIVPLGIDEELKLALGDGFATKTCLKTPTACPKAKTSSDSDADDHLRVQFYSRIPLTAKGYFDSELTRCQHQDSLTDQLKLAECSKYPPMYDDNLISSSVAQLPTETVLFLKSTADMAKSLEFQKVALRNGLMDPIIAAEKLLGEYSMLLQWSAFDYVPPTQHITPLEFRANMDRIMQRAAYFMGSS